MDWIAIARTLFTVLCFSFFTVAVGVAYSKRAKTRYKDAAKLPFLDDDKVGASPDLQPYNGEKHE